MDVIMGDVRDSGPEEKRGSGRAREYGQGRHDSGLYSDELIPRPRGRGFR